MKRTGLTMEERARMRAQNALGCLDPHNAVDLANAIGHLYSKSPGALAGPEYRHRFAAEVLAATEILLRTGNRLSQ